MHEQKAKNNSPLSSVPHARAECNRGCMPSIILWQGRCGGDRRHRRAARANEGPGMHHEVHVTVVRIGFTS